MARRSGLSFFALGLFLYSQICWAQRTITESFTSAANKDSSDMVWNIARGELHPPLLVKAYDDGSGAADLSFLVGDGSDGSFSSLSDYTRFASVSSGTIYLNTDVYDNLQFTNVHILANYVLRPYGSNPLVMRVLGDVQIDGTIDCSGSNGLSTGAGGTGRCGGGDGGSGGTSGQDGTDGGTLVGGGTGGGADIGGGASSGGGGGAYIKAYAIVTDKPDGTNGLGPFAGLRGARTRDDAFLLDIDGAGSGGGGGSNSATDSSVGAGGGAGGGSIRIYLAGDLAVGATGAILASGGDGGSRTGLLAGAGGGGGGGSILIFAGKDVVNGGAIEAIAGAGGSSAGPDGGNGYFGRTWLVGQGGFATGNFENPETNLNVVGDVRYEELVTYTILSKPIDLRNTLPEITGLPLPVVADQGGSTLVYEVAFGESATDPDLLNFALPATYLNAKQKRFFAFRIQLDNLDPLTPARVTDLSVIYNGSTENNFDFVGACGGMAVNSGSGPGPWLLLLFAMPIFVLLGLVIKKPTYQDQP